MNVNINYLIIKKKNCFLISLIFGKILAIVIGSVIYTRLHGFIPRFHLFISYTSLIALYIGSIYLFLRAMYSLMLEMEVV